MRVNPKRFSISSQDILIWPSRTRNYIALLHPAPAIIIITIILLIIFLIYRTPPTKCRKSNTRSRRGTCIITLHLLIRFHSLAAPHATCLIIKRARDMHNNVFRIIISSKHTHRNENVHSLLLETRTFGHIRKWYWYGMEIVKCKRGIRIGNEGGGGGKKSVQIARPNRPVSILHYICAAVEIVCMRYHSGNSGKYMRADLWVAWLCWCYLCFGMCLGGFLVCCK